MAAEFSVGGRTVRATKLTKAIWPEGYTKADLMNYYLQVAPYLLPHLAGRPLSFTRWPHGITEKGFYQKNPAQGTPEWVPRVTVQNTTYLLAEEEATLAVLANLAVIEIHMSMSRTPHFDAPDIAVIDLDPMPPFDFHDAVRVARMVKTALDTLGLKGFAKTSGATGLHIYLPIEPVLDAREVTARIRGLAATLQGAAPDLITLERLVKNRRGVYFDYGQNSPTRTMAAPYSLRPLPGAPVSTPIAWSELERCNPRDFTIATVPRRLKEIGDPMADLHCNPQRLNALSGL